MTANEQPDGLLLDLIRFILNVTTVVGGVVLVGGLLFLLVTRAKPGASETPAGQQQAAQAQTSATATPQAAGGAPASPTANPELIQMGMQLFESQGCTACHTIEGISQGMVGPNLTNIGVRATERAQEAGVADAAAYIHQSIVEPNAFIVPECPTGPCNPGTMPANFGQMLTDEQINALVQFLLSQKGGG